MKTLSIRSHHHRTLVRLGLMAGVSLLVSTGWWVHAANTPDRDPANQRVLSVKTQPLQERTTFAQTRLFLGEVQAMRKSMMGFEVPGALASLLVDAGDTVEAGQVLARLDTARLDAARAEAMAGLQESQAGERLARSTLARLERAAEAQAVSSQQVDEAARQWDRQQAAVARSEAQVERLDVDLEKSHLRAPYAGRLQRRLVDEGTVVPAGQPVFELRESAVPEIRFSLPPELASDLTIGSTVQAKSRRDGDLTLRISRILPGIDEATRAIPVNAEPAEDPVELSEGELVEVVINRMVEQTGFWIPITALAESARGLWSCYVAESQGESGAHVLVRREIEILSLAAESAFVVGNLRDGESLVVDGLHRIVPGQTVSLAAAN